MKLHKYFALLVLVTMPLQLQCGTKQPKVSDQTQLNPQLSLGHANLKTDCAECHESERLPPTEDLNITVKHGNGEDCAVCHTWPAYSKINDSAKTHNPAPKQCMGCHSLAGEGDPHDKRGECAACHAFPLWKK